MTERGDKSTSAEYDNLLIDAQRFREELVKANQPLDQGRADLARGADRIEDEGLEVY
jgi:hypothetical protein